MKNELPHVLNRPRLVLAAVLLTLLATMTISSNIHPLTSSPADLSHLARPHSHSTTTTINESAERNKRGVIDEVNAKLLNYLVRDKYYGMASWGGDSELDLVALMLEAGSFLTFLVLVLGSLTYGMVVCRRKCKFLLGEQWKFWYVRRAAETAIVTNASLVFLSFATNRTFEIWADRTGPVVTLAYLISLDYYAEHVIQFVLLPSCLVVVAGYLKARSKASRGALRCRPTPSG